MNIIKNPAKSRPLSANVKRLMKMARETPINPNVEKIERVFTIRDLAYCDMQANIFMAAIDRNYSIEQFAPLYMNSQFAGVMDYSFSCAGGMENDDTSLLLRIPLLLKSPELIVDAVLWLNNIVSKLQLGESPNAAVLQACMSDTAIPQLLPVCESLPIADESQWSIERLTDEYEYAYWLGYIYRYECLLHDESSRMVYGAFSEPFMRQTYAQMVESGIGSEALSDCAGEICKRLDMLLIGKLWK